MTRYNYIVLVLLCSLGTAWAINVELGTKDLVQPDGTRFSVREYMDEYGHHPYRPCRRCNAGVGMVA